ncbi:MAG TPA: hypothetical protein VKZ18_29055 [Polyangia bacterium]|nr:hypothetical protein [Polyangia bacterium]
MTRRPPLRRPFALAAALALPLALAACGRVPGQFEIFNNAVPMSSDQGCTVPVDPTVYQGSGMLDLSAVSANFGSAYFLFPLIENNLPSSSSGSGIDPNEIQLGGFQIDITPIGAAPPTSVESVFANNGALTHYQISWSGGVSSGGGHITAIAGAFPVALAQQLSAAGGIGSDPSLTVDLTISAFGTTNTGTHMTSDPFHFPLQICTACLAQNLGPCPLAAAPVNKGNACNPAQDMAIGCCTQNGALVCPATVIGQ